VSYDIERWLTIKDERTGASPKWVMRLEGGLVTAFQETFGGGAMRRYAVAVVALVMSGLLSPSVAQELAGQWVGRVTCGGQYAEMPDWKLVLSVSHSGGASYALQASMSNAQGAGSIRGSSVSFSAGNFLNSLTFRGTVSGSRMSGKYTQATGHVCSWNATKVGGIKAPAPITREAAKDAMGVPCSTRRQQVMDAQKEADHYAGKLNRHSGKCDLDQQNFSKLLHGAGLRMQDLARYYSTCDPVTSKEFRARADRFVNSGLKAHAHCLQ
jgi:hypothetical protein